MEYLQEVSSRNWQSWICSLDTILNIVFYCWRVGRILSKTAGENSRADDYRLIGLTLFFFPLSSDLGRNTAFAADLSRALSYGVGKTTNIHIFVPVGNLGCLSELCILKSFECWNLKLNQAFLFFFWRIRFNFNCYIF